jgi:hypothetical protein
MTAKPHLPPSPIPPRDTTTTNAPSFSNLNRRRSTIPLVAAVNGVVTTSQSTIPSISSNRSTGHTSNTFVFEWS